MSVHNHRSYFLRPNSPYFQASLREYGDVGSPKWISHQPIGQVHTRIPQATVPLLQSYLESREILRTPRGCGLCTATSSNTLSITSTSGGMRLHSRLPSGPSLHDFIRRGEAASCDPQALGPEQIPYLPGTSIMSVQKGRVYIETYGCQMNVNDLEVVLAIMKNAGYSEIVDKAEEADVILINTCAIRDNAEHKIWHRLNYFKHLKSKWNRNVEPSCSRSEVPPKVAVLGCMAERLKEKLVEANKMVDVVCGPDAYRDLPRLLATVDEGNTAVNTLLSLEETYADVTPVRISKNCVSAFVSIMRGCNNMCAYCIVPFTRGRERSRPADSIQNEVNQLWEQGVKEVLLLGQNVNSYNDVSGRLSGEEVLRLGGRDYPWYLSSGFSSICRSKEDGLRFSDLLDRLSAQFPEMRFRFTSPHPKDFPDELLFLMRERTNVCKNIHLPAQSGSTRILEKMRRGYTREAYLSLVDRIRTILPDSSLSSDFIAGFCGETEEDHADTLSLIEMVGYDMAYMFAYSLREKTHAHRNYEDDVPEPIKQRRLSELINMFRQTTISRFESQIGTVQLVLVTGPNKRDPTEWIGQSDKGHKVVFANRSLPLSFSLLPDKMNMLKDTSGAAANESMSKQYVSNQQVNKIIVGPCQTCNTIEANLNSGPAACMDPRPGDYVEVLIMETSTASLRGYPLARTNLRTFFSKTTKNHLNHSYQASA